ncbi:unnamed protein product [Cylindrotheca closterium]|uniref:HSF-type DNA-binding domain-containing protein n=1 Tax=Cylindrotheca closterium TaxID=2856 RepID=A0AAD2FZS4_9STRA|nr:unnamed protein product [Cylindrotheca closterium]
MKSNFFTKRAESPTASGIQFPWKLHNMLDNAETEGYNAVVSWDGKNGFKVHDKDAFVADIVPKYFSQTKYRSFQRMLNMWGFQRVREGARKGAYIHENFRRGEPDLCNRMKCEKIKRRHTIPKTTSMNKNIDMNTLQGSTPKNKADVDLFEGMTFHAVEGVQEANLQDLRKIPDPSSRKFSSMDYLFLDEMLNVFDSGDEAPVF